MSREHELNQELSEFERSLRSLPQPQLNVNRDQLMYEAGWAAATSMLASSRNDRAPKRTIESIATRHSYWPALAGCLALTTATLGILLLGQIYPVGQTNPNRQSELATAVTIPAATVATHEQLTRTPLVDAKPDDGQSNWLMQRLQFNRPHVSFQQRRLEMAFREPANVSVAGPADLMDPEPRTSSIFQLMNELLPEQSGRSAEPSMRPSIQAKGEPS